MNKIFFKDKYIILAATALAASGFIMGVPQASAEIPGNYLTADLNSADLSGIINKYPASTFTILAIFIIFCIGYGIYWFVTRKKRKAG